MSYIYLPEFFLAECQVAERLIKLRGNKCEELPANIDGLLYNQPDAVLNACQSRISLITGCAGTGKTTCLKKVIDAFEEAQMVGYIIAPTGKAAKRAWQVVNENREVPVDCLTAHRALGYNPSKQGFTFNEHNLLTVDYLVIDEFSMCDLQLFAAILAALDPLRTRLILCGDPFQLPSVGPGNIARDVISTHLFPMAKLNRIIRQGEKSGIVYNSHQILKGEKLTEMGEDGVKFTDFFVVSAEDVEHSHDSIIKYATESLQERRGISPAEVQIVVPGKKGKVGVDNLNQSMRNKLNPRGREQFNYRIGDKILVTKNDYRKGVVNGDVGYVVELNQKGVEIQVDGLSGTTLFSPDELHELRLAYAFTVHKSQGSEFKAVIYPCHTTHWILHSRNLLYTGLTRGKELTILIGDKKSISQSIKNNKPIRRITGLKTRLLQEAGKHNITA